MRNFTSLFVAFGLVASVAFAGDGEGCPQCKASSARTSTLAAARTAIADAKKADEKLPAEKRAELNKARDFLMQTALGKTMGPTYEACGWLMLASAKQPGTSPEAAALMMDMGMTFCSVAKVFGGCADCKCCEGGECCKSCSEMDVAKITAKAKESLAKSQDLMKAAMAVKMTQDDMQKIQAAVDLLKDGCPMMPALDSANDALDDAFKSLAKMGIPSAEGKAVRDELVKAAFQLHSTMNSCEECEGCEEGCEGCDEGMEEGEEAPAPAKTS
jgi:hypothetical protein